jgi:CheY-like chemotaxis protein
MSRRHMTLEPPTRPAPPVPAAPSLATDATEDGEAPRLPLPAATPSAGTILCVVPDGVSARLVELSVASEGVKVEVARSVEAALEIAGHQRIDLVVADLHLPDASGLELHRRLRGEGRLASVGFVIWSADAGADERVAAFRAGVDDVVPKPCGTAELGARLCAQLERQRRRALTRQRRYALAGELAALGVSDLVGLLELGRKTGVLSFSTPRASAEIHLVDGRIVHAVHGNLTGPAAFYALMGEERGQFELGPSDPGAPRTIDLSVAELVLEGARHIDEERERRRQASKTPRAQTLPAAVVPPPAPQPVEAPPVAAAARRASASRFVRDLTDGFSLGELQVWTHAELGEWTHKEQARERVHVILVSEMASGIGAMLAAGGAVSERAVVAALDPRPRVAGMVFRGRDERLLDVILVDVKQPMVALASLRRPATILVLAPADGDGLGVGAGTRLQLAELVTRLKPGVLLGVGNATIDATVRSLQATGSARLARARLNGILGEGRCDLRHALTQALAVWGNQP